MLIYRFLVFFFILIAHNSAHSGRESFRIVQEYPHDRSAFTQGLVFHDGFLYESTGLYGQSSLRKVELETGRVVQYKALDPRFFGEGITIFKGKIYQLTWKANTGFIYDLKTFDQIGQFRYSIAGWGLTDNGSELIVSDGTEWIYFYDPLSFNLKRKLEVRGKDGKPVKLLNELEFINGKIWANVWQSDLIVVIDPESGLVEREIYLTDISKQMQRSNDDVLNGIAWDAKGKRLFVTGKKWPKLFEIEGEDMIEPNRPTAVVPMPQEDDFAQGWWMDRHEEKVKLAKEQDFELLLVGDSITHAWENEASGIWEKFFEEYSTFNIGFSGDRTEQVIWRLQDGTVAGINPKLAIVMIGTNNTGHRQDPADETALGIEKIVGELRDRLPKTKILLFGVFPRGATKDDPMRILNREINALISKFADGERVFYLDISSKFMDENEVISVEIMPDLLHLSPAGYEIWAGELKPKIEEFLAE